MRIYQPFKICTLRGAARADSLDVPNGITRHSNNWRIYGSISAHACTRLKQVQFPPQVSGSSGGSWPLPGQVDGSTAAGSREPGSSDSINSRIQMMKTEARPHGSIRCLLQVIYQKESTAKQKPRQFVSYLTEFVTRYRNDASSPALLAVPLATPVPQFWFANPGHQKI